MQNRYARVIRPATASTSPAPSMIGLVLIVGAAAPNLVACAEDDVGGLTARIEFGAGDKVGLQTVGAQARSIGAQGANRAAGPDILRRSAVPDFVDRLQILALDTDGSTLAETNLYADPGPTQLRLFREGGTWSLDGVPAGEDRRLVGRAYFGPNSAPRLDRALVYTGELAGIDVVAGRTTNAGVLVLQPGPVRVPEADFEGPPPPLRPTAAPVAAGRAIIVSWSTPDVEDIAGYMIAISEMSTTGPDVEPARAERFAIGAALDERFRVAALVDGDATSARLDGLTDGVPISVALYAFDDDATGAPLNYGAPALVFGTPFDSAAPGPITGLVARVRGAEQADIEFVAPGEDGLTDSAGRPQRYDVRTAPSAGELTTPGAFDNAAGVEPPTVAAPGTTVLFSRTLRALGITIGVPRFIGVRAVDAAGNRGAVAVAAFTLTSSRAPVIDRFRPAIAIAGREVLIEGRRFGLDTGTVTLTGTETTTTTIDLPTSGWADEEILVQLPPDATTGIVTVTRTDGEVALDGLTVITQRAGILPNDGLPFGFAAAGPRGQVAALYRERGNPVDAAIERFIDLVPDTMPWAATTLDRRTDQVAVGQSDQRFLFATRDADGRLDLASVTTSTDVPASPFRQTTNLGPTPPDALGVALRPTTDDTVPALVVFTLQGTLRTGGIDDARNGPPNVFFPITSTAAEYDAATVAVAADGAALLGHRTVTGTTARLTLRRSLLGDPGDFVEVDPGPGEPPLAGPNILIRPHPQTAASFVIAYEHVGLDGQTRIRLFAAEHFGTTPGIAPFEEVDLELQDVGWVTRATAVYLAVTAVRPGRNSTVLHYTELPYSAIDGSQSEGLWPGAILDVGPADTRARLGCAFQIMAACPIAWMGASTGIVFLRR